MLFCIFYEKDMIKYRGMYEIVLYVINFMVDFNKMYFCK